MYLRCSSDLMFTILSSSPYGVDFSVLIANISVLIVNSSLLQSPDESTAKTGTQYSKCGRIKDKGLVNINHQTRAATLLKLNLCFLADLCF